MIELDNEVQQLDEKAWNNDDKCAIQSSEAFKEVFKRTQSGGRQRNLTKCKFH